jgi:N-acetylglucosamine malate deacetylase 1
MSRYLFLSAHCDDHEISCGGTIQKLKEQGHDVFCQALSWCNNTYLQDEFDNSHDVLGIPATDRRVYEHEVRKFNPQLVGDFFYNIRDYYDYVFTHSVNDRHDDHRIVGEQARRVLNCNLITFMSPYNGDLCPNYFVDLDMDHIQTKIKAIHCYKSQMHRKYMTHDAIVCQSIANGIRSGSLKHAEAFKVERLIT